MIEIKAATVDKAAMSGSGAVASMMTRVGMPARTTRSHRATASLPRWVPARVAQVPMTLPLRRRGGVNADRDRHRKRGERR